MLFRDCCMLTSFAGYGPWRAALLVKNQGSHELVGEWAAAAVATENNDVELWRNTQTSLFSARLNSQSLEPTTVEAERDSKLVGC
jgi:hypothetical protein